MKHKELEFAGLSLPRAEIYLAMDYRGSIPDEYIQSLIDDVLHEASNVCIPRFQCQVLDATLLAGHRLQIQDTSFSIGNVIGSYVAGMTQACLFVATAGKEYDAYLRHLRVGGDIVKEFVADSIGSVIAEVCVAELCKELDELPSMKHSLPYSPGYCGWNIREQQKLFAFFPAQPCDITLSDSYLMSPVKSISGFIGLGKELEPQPYRCEICNNKHCYKRKEKSHEKYEKVGG